MNAYLIGFIAFLIGFFGIIISQYQNLKATSLDKSNDSAVVYPTIALSPPVQAKDGFLTILSGAVQKISLGESSYADVASGVKVYHGEAVATKANATAFIAFQGYADARLSQNSEIVFANTLPSDFVMQQKMGTIEYTVIRPVSVRVLKALVSLEPGLVTIALDDSKTTVTPLKGIVKIALIDNENNTQVYEVSPGQKATIDNDLLLVNIN